MKRLPYYTILFVLVMTAACRSTQYHDTIFDDEIGITADWIQEKNFEFTAEWAMPLTTNSLNQISNAGLLPPGSNAARINLIGNQNYFRMQGDSVSAQLPYYGERQFGGGYGNQNTGIKFNGLVENLEVKKSNGKQSYRFRFNINDAAEAYRVNVEIHPNKNTIVRINSSQRFTIGYQGQVQALEEASIN